MAIIFTGLAQQMPYNPDANGDDFVGVDDVLGVLGVYDTALLQPDLTCDYDGTDLEQFMGGLFEQNLVLDSIYVEYLIVDSVTTFLPGCPAPVTIETILERSYTMLAPYINFYAYSNRLEIRGDNFYLDYNRLLYFKFFPESGSYFIEVLDDEIGALTSYSSSSTSMTGLIPFPDNWVLDENGIDVGFGPHNWISNCESFRLIPFWHEAE